MKTKIITLLLLNLTIFAFGQANFMDCVVKNSDLPPPDGTVYSSDPNLYLYGDPLVFNVFYWQVRDPNGEFGGQEFSQTKVLENIAYLNKFFNQYNIFFKYRGYDGFDTPANLPLKELVYDEVQQEWVCEETGQFDPDGYGFIDRCQYGEFLGWVNSQGYKEPNAINIYVPYGSQFGGAALGGRVILKINKLTDSVVLHELAHTFGLAHTRSNMELYISERATRDPNGPFYYNADTAADGLVQTAAHDVFYDRVCGDGNDPACYPTINSEACSVDQFSEEKDYDGQYTKPHIAWGDVVNLMSTAYLCTENFFFTAQVNKMRSHIENSSYLQGLMTNVAALYEPYAGDYSDPTVTGLLQPFFQPGFDYQFLNCYPDGGYPLPSDYYDTSFSYVEGGLWWYGFSKDITPSNYYTIKHKDRYAIRIEQIEQQPRKCWNTGQGAISGTLVKFNDGVLNTNVTVTPQDSTAINNPQFINNLQPGLYNVIKNYQTGETQENIVQKNNN